MANPKGNRKSLKSIRSVNEARMKGRNGGIASGIARRKKRDIKEFWDIMNSSAINKKDTVEALRKTFNGLKGEEVISYDAGIIAQTIKKAVEGDVSAMRLYYDTCFKMREISKTTEEEIKENEHNENELIKALNSQSTEVWDDGIK